MKAKDQSVTCVLLVCSLFQLRRAAVPAFSLAGLILAACASELDNPDLQAPGSAGAGGVAGSPPFTTGGVTTGGSPPLTTGGVTTGGSPPLTTGGTPATGTGGSGPAVSDCWKNVIQVNCVACHSATGLKFGGLDLSGGDAAIARVVGIAATNAEVADKSGCTPGALLVDPANPMNSVLYRRLKNLQGTCGTAMPQGFAMTATDSKCLEDWILSF